MRCSALVLLIVAVVLPAGCGGRAATAGADPCAGPSSAAASPAVPAGAGVVVNPVVEQRADPSVYRAPDGFYYLTDSVPAYDVVELRRATTLAGLATARPVVVFHTTADGPQSGWIWAPDIRFYDGAWYIYYSASPAAAKFDHRLYSLTNRAADPMAGSWTSNGELQTGTDSFAIDATSFVQADRRYLLWAQKDPTTRANSNIYIAALATPTTISGPPIELSAPTLPWETVGYAVNEAPAALVRNGHVFVTYSASATDAHYAMGLLSAPATADLLDPANWTKSPDPVFRSCAAHAVFGPGSNSFTVSADGRDVINVYNARSYANVADPITDRNRSIRMQKVGWRPDGFPDFGIPVAAGPTPL